MEQIRYTPSDIDKYVHEAQYQLKELNKSFYHISDLYMLFRLNLLNIIADKDITDKERLDKLIDAITKKTVE